jgi:hypothetical protein
MCYEIYIASDKPLKTIHWDEKNRKLNVNKIDPKDEIIRKVFSKPHIYYIGSHLKCGCGFFYESSLTLDCDEREVARQVNQSQEELKEYIRQSLGKSKEIELYVSWEGEKEKGPLKTIRLTDKNVERHFNLEERHFYLIKK